MTMNKRLLVWIVLSFIFVVPVQAIQKCVDANGVVSYQDKPCKANEKAENIAPKLDKDSKNPANLVPVFIKIPRVGSAVLFSYRWWETVIIQVTPDMPPTVRMTSKPGEERLSFSINFIPNQLGKRYTLDEMANLVTDMAQPFVAGSIEREVLLEKVDTTIGTAVYASFNESKYLKEPIPEDEYSSATMGFISHADLAVGFTILTNGTENSKALQEALNIIRSFMVRTPTQVLSGE